MPPMISFVLTDMAVDIKLLHEVVLCLSSTLGTVVWIASQNVPSRWLSFPCLDIPGVHGDLVALRTVLWLSLVFSGCLASALTIFV